VLAIRKGLTGGQEATASGDALREKVEEVAVRGKEDGNGAVSNGEGSGLE
jgi:hypothetical protein